MRLRGPALRAAVPAVKDRGSHPDQAARVVLAVKAAKVDSVVLRVAKAVLRKAALPARRVDPWASVPRAALRAVPAVSARKAVLAAPVVARAAVKATA